MRRFRMGAPSALYCSIDLLFFCSLLKGRAPLHFFFSTRSVSDGFLPARSAFLHAERQRGISLRTKCALLFFCLLQLSGLDQVLIGIGVAWVDCQDLA